VDETGDRGTQHQSYEEQQQRDEPAQVIRKVAVAHQELQSALSIVAHIREDTPRWNCTPELDFERTRNGFTRRPRRRAGARSRRGPSRSESYDRTST
jgi:hypothetical protein